MTSVPMSCSLTLTRAARGACAALALALVLFAAPARGSDEPERLTVIRAGKIITGTGEEIHDGVIVLSGAKIQNVGKGLEYPLNAKVIDARDRVVMPGLINPSSRFGLPGYNRAEVHGNWTVADENFPAPDEYDELLDAGYTTVALVPAGGGIPGRAIVVHTAGPKEQRVLRAPSYLRVTPDKRVFRGALERAQQEIDKVEKAKQEFEKKQEQERKAAPPAPPSQPGSQPTSQPASAPATQPAFQPPPIDPAHQVLVDLIQKKPDVFALLELNGASDYAHQSEVLKKFDIAHQFLARNAQQSDFTFVAEQIGAQKPRIVLQPVINRAPNSAQRINIVRQFAQAGCEVSLMPLVDNAEEHRQILGRIAMLVREGWARVEALKAVTLHPARLLGLDSRLGSIEKDKDADLIFLDADPLDPRARVREVMIGGEIVRRVEVPE